MMDRTYRTPYLLTIGLVCLMSAQSILGLAFRDVYIDAPWIRAAWFGNDLITLVLAVPLTAAALILVRRGSARGVLGWMGMLAYAIYNYAYYMLGVELNVFFPLYVVALVTGAISLILVLARLEPSLFDDDVRVIPMRRTVGGYFLFVAAGLTVAWLGMWGVHVFRGADLPVEKSAFRLVASLDLALMVPVLSAAGLLLWRRRPWGVILAAMAGLQGSLYLLVLTTNSMIAISRGIVEPPGEAPVWGILCLLTTAATAQVLTHVGRATGSQ